jgi:WD40 repeat protein
MGPFLSAGRPQEAHHHQEAPTAPLHSWTFSSGYFKAEHICAMVAYTPSVGEQGPLPCRVVVASSEGKCRVFCTGSGALLHDFPALEKEDSALASYITSDPEAPRLVRATDHGKLQAWDGDTFEPLMEREVPAGGGCLLVFAGPDGSTRIGVGHEGGFHVLDCASLDFVASSGPQPFATACLAACPGGESGQCLLVVGDVRGGLRVFDAGKGQLLRELQGHQTCVNKLVGLEPRWAPGKHYLVSSSEDGRVKLWDPERGRLLRTLVRRDAEGHTSELRALAVCEDTLVYTGDCRGIVRVRGGGKFAVCCLRPRF